VIVGAPTVTWLPLPVPVLVATPYARASSVSTDEGSELGTSSFRKAAFGTPRVFHEWAAHTRPTIGEDGGMTFARIDVEPHLARSVSFLPPRPPKAALQVASTDAPAQWSQLIGPTLMIIATLVGAVVLRWVLHRAIDRVVDNALARAAAHETRLPTERPASCPRRPAWTRHARRQRAATMGAILKSTATFAIFAIALLTVMATLGYRWHHCWHRLVSAGSHSPSARRAWSRMSSLASS